MHIQFPTCLEGFPTWWEGFSTINNFWKQLDVLQFNSILPLFTQWRTQLPNSVHQFRWWPQAQIPREENVYPLQYSCLENSMDRGAWWLQSSGSQSILKHDWETKILTFHRSSVHFSSVSYSLWLTWIAKRQGSLSITNSQSLLKLMSIEAVMPSNHLVLCHPLLLPPSIFPSIKVFSNKLVLLIRQPKYWSFSVSISPYNEYSGLISFRINWLDLLAVQGTLKSLLQ